MTADKAVIALVGALESLAIPYIVSGSLGTNVYGVPRATDDGDFVLELPPAGRIGDIAQALPEMIRLEPQGRFETTTWIPEAKGNRLPVADHQAIPRSARRRRSARRPANHVR